jgi:hypothetical protein
MLAFAVPGLLSTERHAPQHWSWIGPRVQDYYMRADRLLDDVIPPSVPITPFSTARYGAARSSHLSPCSRFMVCNAASSFTAVLAACIMSAIGHLPANKRHHGTRYRAPVMLLLGSLRIRYL